MRHIMTGNQNTIAGILLSLVFTGISSVRADQVEVTRVGQWPPSHSAGAYAVGVSSNYVYIGTWEQELRVIEISDPGKPVALGGADIGGRPYGIALSGNRLYIA